MIGKQKTIKCPNDSCSYCIDWAGNRYEYSMNRAYVKDKGNWTAIGWYCKRCGTFIPDKNPKFRTVPFIYK